MRQGIQHASRLLAFLATVVADHLRVMRDKRRMAANDFEALRPLMKISKDRQDAARLALVDGQTLQGIANIYGLTRQAVGSSVSVVWKVYERWQESQRTATAAAGEIPQGWEHVSMIAPSALVAKFKAEVAQATTVIPAKMVVRKKAGKRTDSQSLRPKNVTPSEDAA